jgi:hypothetical protein
MHCMIVDGGFVVGEANVVVERYDVVVVVDVEYLVFFLRLDASSTCACLLLLLFMSVCTSSQMLLLILLCSS